MRRFRGPWLVVLLAAMIVPCIGVDNAHAGDYVMRSCNVPGEPAAPVGPWTWMFVSSEIFANDECGQGGGFGLSASTITTGNTAAVHLGVPRDGSLAAITIRRVRLWMIARLDGSGGTMYVNFSSGTNTAEMHRDLFASPGGSTLATPFVSPPMLDGTHLVFVGFACTGATCQPASPNPLEIRGAEVTLNESAGPSGAVDQGPLLDGRPQSGVRALTFRAVDAESGVAEVSVLLGGTVVATRDFRAECAYANFAACPTARNESIMVDTRNVSDGNHAVAVRVTDAAGNRETITAASAVSVANGGTGGSPDNGTGATPDARLTATFSGHRGSTVLIPYSKRLTVRGRLTAATGTPIGGARVEIVETPIESRRQAPIRTILTRADGRFTYSVRRRGMSRTLRIRYRPNMGQGSIAASRLLRVRVAAAGTLRVALRGVRVSYRGRIVSRPIPASGKKLYVEGRALGGRWTSFAVRRTDAAGRFSGRYRLRVHRPGVRLQFRLRIPTQPGYPYATGVGRAVTRTVR